MSGPPTRPHGTPSTLPPHGLNADEVARRLATHGPNRLAEVQPLSTLERLLHESLTDGSQLLLLGAMVIGLLSGADGETAMQPFAGDLFKGVPTFFLLDMGLLAARNMGELRGKPVWLLAYAVTAPPVHAGLALLMGVVLGISAGNTALLMVLAASASYIAVPAVIRHAIPEARPSLCIGMSLGLTFPLNILLGIPVYTAVAQCWPEAAPRCASGELSGGFAAFLHHACGGNQPRREINRRWLWYAGLHG